MEKHWISELPARFYLKRFGVFSQTPGRFRWQGNPIFIIFAQC